MIIKYIATIALRCMYQSRNLKRIGCCALLNCEGILSNHSVLIKTGIQRMYTCIFMHTRQNANKNIFVACSLQLFFSLYILSVAEMRIHSSTYGHMYLFTHLLLCDNFY